MVDSTTLQRNHTFKSLLREALKEEMVVELLMLVLHKCLWSHEVTNIIQAPVTDTPSVM